MSLTSFLICESQVNSAQELQSSFNELKIPHDTVHNGKDAQLKLFKQKFQVILMDINLKQNSSLEVIKYIKQNHLNTKIILIFNSKKELEEYNIDNKDLIELSILTLFRPYDAKKVFNLLNSNLKMFSWNLPTTAKDELYKSIVLNDNNLTKINISDFIFQNEVLFDLYIRLAKDKYVKIVNRGEALDSKRLMEYATEKKVPHLYFLTKERSFLIGCLNNLSHKIVNSPNYKANQKIDLIEKTSQLYIDELYTQGLNPDSLDEGIKICDNIFSIIRHDQDLAKLFDELEAENMASLNHSFVTALFCSIICKNLKWASKITTDKILLSAFLHNLGKLKLPANFKNKNIWELTDKEKPEYFKYIEHTVQMLQKHEKVSSAIKIIISQQHEYVTGFGFPNRISGLKIYPLAKILCFASEFADYLIFYKLDVKTGIQQLLQKKEIIERYDTCIIKAFINGFMGKKS